MKYKEIPLNHYFTFTDSATVFCRISPAKIRQLGKKEVEKWSKNVEVSYIGDIDKIYELAIFQLNSK